MNIAQNFLVAFPGITEQFTDLQAWEAQAQRLKAGDSEQMIINIGRSAGAGERPEQGEAIIHNIEV